MARRNLSVLFANEKDTSNEFIENGEVIPEEEEKQEPKKKTLPWQKNKGKRANNKKSGKKTSVKKETDDKKKVAVRSSKTASKTKDEESESCSEDDAEDDVEVDESDEVEAEAEEKSANNDSSEPEKDDDQLEKLQSDVAMRRQRLLEGKSQFSHSVYCPFFPEDKQEYWWAYITDRKQQMLLTAPFHITNLVEHEEIQLKFTAPFKPGFYTFAVCLRSDSYFGFDQMKDIKV